LKFINLTRHTEIGANSYYLEIGRHRLILDCGMHPKNTGEDALPLFKAVSERDIEAILISHRHIAAGDATLPSRASFHDGHHG
jgi:Cft2 family RNA processing exonuclease